MFFFSHLYLSLSLSLSLTTYLTDSCLVYAVTSQLTFQSQQLCLGTACVHSWHWHSVLPPCLLSSVMETKRSGALTEEQIAETDDENIPESSLSELS